MAQRRDIPKMLFAASQTALASSIAWGVLIVVVVVGLLFVAYKAKFAVPIEYEGRVVDKWAGYSHLDEGSFPYFKILVETDNGQKLTVAVDRENYERAKVGMRIKKTQKGIELTRIEPTKADAIQAPWAIGFKSGGRGGVPAGAARAGC